MYFAAADHGTLAIAESTTINILSAVNELETLGPLDKLIALKKNILLDSGVYWLSTQHAQAHGITMDKALGLAPDKVDNFDKLFDTYVELTSARGDQIWGYIEIDQGGRENKIKTRARLEAMGLRPIPVYHPFNDGWEYFDYLAERYDRICFGNVVMAETPVRKRLLATAWERRRKYPHLWIHMLGLTPNELTTAFPINSCDSSAWISSVRWGRHQVTVMNKILGDLDRGFVYDVGAHAESDRGHEKSRRMCGYDAHVINVTMHACFADQRDELGCDPGGFV